MGWIDPMDYLLILTDPRLTAGLADLDCCSKDIVLLAL